MPLYLVYEWDNAKETKRLNNYRKLIDEVTSPYSRKLNKEGICKTTGLSDNTGHMMSIWEFEDLDAFGKVWNDDNYHSMMIKLNQLVDNMKIRICRSGRPIAPQEIT
jgi:hypothetical protein